MLMAVRGLITRRRRRTAILLSVLALAFLLVLAHGAVRGGHMAMSEHGGMSVDGALAVCLAVGQTAAFGLAALALTGSSRAARPVFGALPAFSVLGQAFGRTVRVGARAGPEVLQVFRR